jgi:hypothetical protein
VQDRSDQEFTDAGRTRVFLSYSRKDLAFVQWLSCALGQTGCLADYDLSVDDPDNVDLGISAEDIWWTRLQEMITAAHVVVFVVSPDSAHSPICDEEIALAQALRKRIIPVLCRHVNFAKAPPRLSAINVKLSFIGDEDQRRDALARLTAAIQRDIPWLRTSSRLSLAAAQWESSGRSADHLLRGVELREAENWATRRPATAPEHSELLLAYLAASRDAEGERRMIGEIEKARYLELVATMHPFLEEEIRIREAEPRANHGGVANEMRLELEALRALLYLESKWHPQPANFVQSTGAREGYAEIFRFPCCGRIAEDFRSLGVSEPPSQFRSDGCASVPEAIQHEYRARANPFHSLLVARYRSSVGAKDS